ncbi:MAG: sulfite exporter TauE/SafE family protein [Methyloligellaceae bacterium]
MVGVSKGGFSAIGVVGVPILSLMIPPFQAAAIMLPILIAMDMTGLYAWRGVYDRKSLIALLPAAFLGIAIGWLTAALISETHVKLMLGIIVIWFVLAYWLRSASSELAQPHNYIKGSLYGAVAGFTSFVSHSGGPPVNMYMLPLRIDPKKLVGTMVIVFTAINLLKVPPYLALGQFSTENIMTSLMLLPIAPLGVFAGAWMVKRVEPEIFFRVSYLLLFPVGLKLAWDGFKGIM